MNDWSTSDSLVRLAVLAIAAVAIPTVAWRRVGGKPISYVALMLGVASLMLGESFRLLAFLHPGLSVAGFATELPVHAGGFVLLLLGFLSLMQDVRQTQIRDRRAASDEHTRAEIARRQEAKLRAILDGATDYCIITCDPEGRITSYSNGSARILGWEADEAVGKMNVDEFCADGGPVTVADVFKTVEREGHFEAEVPIVRKDGARIPVLLTVTRLTDADGNLEGYVGIAKDIAEMRAARDALRRERDFVQGILETNELFIVGVSLANGRITMFNHGAERISGYRRNEVVGREYAKVFLPAEDHPRIRKMLEGIRTRTRSAIGQHENTILTKSGEGRVIAWTYNTSSDESGQPCYSVGFGHDVTEQRRMQASIEQAKADLEEANAALARLATTDYLTGLVNRRQADMLFEREIARSRRNGTAIGVVMMDLDRFKSINDTHGHEVGDVCLKHVAAMLRERLRASDIVARYGGEEFLLVLPETARDDAATLADSVRRRIAESVVAHGDLEIRLAASAGVAVLEPGQDISADELVRRADQAMYYAKELGGNRVATWHDTYEGKFETSVADSG